MSNTKIMESIAKKWNIITKISIISTLIYVLFMILAIIYWPDNYSFWGNIISDLGREYTSLGHSNIFSPLILTIGYFFLAIGGSLIYFLMLAFYYNHQILDIRILSFLGSISGISGTIFLILIGVFPLDTAWELHNISANSMYILTIIGITSFTIIEFYKSEVKNWHYIPPIGVLVTTFMYLFLPGDIPILAVGIFRPVMQKLSLIFILIAILNFNILIRKNHRIDSIDHSEKE